MIKYKKPHIQMNHRAIREILEISKSTDAKI